MPVGEVNPGDAVTRKLLKMADSQLRSKQPAEARSDLRG